MNIYQRLNEVRKAVQYVQKDKRVGEGGYLAVTHDAVTAITREHFVKHGILIVPSILASKVELTGTSTARGIPFIRFEARYHFDVVNADDPIDRFGVEIEAHAIDQGDKAPGKALSYAKKYAVLKLLEIESGEEEEERQEQHKPKVPSGSAAQVAKDAFDILPPERKNVVLDTATQIVDALNEGRDFDAFGLCESIEEAEEKVALWSRLDSKQRSRIKAQGREKRENALKAVK
jgi:hypothetical protein